MGKFKINYANPKISNGFRPVDRQLVLIRFFGGLALHIHMLGTR